MNMIRARETQVDDCPIAVIVSEYNRDITLALQEGAVAQLLKKGISESNILVVTVPGGVEIPIVAQRLAKTKQYAAIVTLGVVIRGETTHYDYVCEQVSQGCQQVALAYDVPVIFGLVTTETKAQAWDRVGGDRGHKGVDAADTALVMIDVLQQLTV
ncbi:MAG: 6,7-dimethyl-8-ribityllumazine synthase [Gammaproteobacteria bacterium]|nr:6,7-dimethyl-8-ribityllumazine synthase [Gammaproteobacteria bacterium]